MLLRLALRARLLRNNVRLNIHNFQLPVLGLDIIFFPHQSQLSRQFVPLSQVTRNPFLRLSPIFAIVIRVAYFIIMAGLVGFRKMVHNQKCATEFYDNAGGLSTVWIRLPSRLLMKMVVSLGYDYRD